MRKIKNIAVSAIIVGLFAVGSLTVKTAIAKDNGGQTPVITIPYICVYENIHCATINGTELLGRKYVFNE